jgi:hypothetical protein
VAVSDFYDPDGRPIELLEWAQMFESDRRVAHDHAGGYRVSTVWLGLDHQLIPGAPPLIFETMLFGKGKPRDQDQFRYSTLEQAREGHAAILRELAGEGDRASADDEGVSERPERES